MSEATGGLICVDKPAGLSSHDVVREVRRLTGIRRVGHTGTLDPTATGVLLICIGRATRLAEYVVGLPKQYETTIRLGQETDTYDSEGNILAERPVTVTRSALLKALDRFRGPIDQTPPMFSAVKRGGQPLYKRARRGEVLPRPPRRVTIYELELLAWESPDLQVKVVCSTGTYIRSLAHDLGQELGCGGHVRALRRTAVGRFVVADAVALGDLSAANWPAFLLPPDAAVSHLPALTLTAEEARDLLFGRQVEARSGQPEAGLARAYAPDGDFIGLVTAGDGRWKPEKLFPQLGPGATH
jgi:tRNA pseudouridine55 synthase